MTNPDTLTRETLPTLIDNGLEAFATGPPASQGGGGKRKETCMHLNRLHKKLGSSPLILFFLGALSLVLWLAASIVQIQTSEYLALGNPTRVATVAWGVLTQPWLMITGQAPIH